MVAPSTQRNCRAPERIMAYFITFVSNPRFTAAGQAQSGRRACLFSGLGNRVRGRLAKLNCSTLRQDAPAVARATNGYYSWRGCVLSTVEKTAAMAFSRKVDEQNN